MNGTERPRPRAELPLAGSPSSPALLAEDAAPVHRLSDLRRGRPADNTLGHLLGVLNSKFELGSWLPILAWEAANEGHESCAAVFRELADIERRSFDDLLGCLRLHLDETTGGTGREATLAARERKAA